MKGWGMEVIRPYEVREYVTGTGKNPFRAWFKKLDKLIRTLIQQRLLRVKLGHLGNYRALAGGVYELKIKIGPGYRIYFGIEAQKVILLLLGGDKGSQARDIFKAREYWADYLTKKE